MPASLPTRPLGRNGPPVTALGFGAMGLSAFYGSTESDEERFKVLDRAYELGETNWDSSNVYGDNEVLIGKWFARTGKRKEIFLATKFGILVDEKGNRSHRNDPEYVREAIELSLKRLQTDYVDLYYIHRFSGETPVEDTIAVMSQLVKEGKVRHIGLSEASAQTIRRAHAVHPVSALQIEYSPWTLDIESSATSILSTCRELGIAIIAYSPLGRGFLTGQYKSPDDFEEGDFRKNNPRFSKENFAKNLDLVEKIKGLADQKGCTSGQLTLAWLMAQGEDIIPIPGTKKIKYLDENMGALDVRISKEEDEVVRKVIASAQVSGDRYPEAGMKLVFADTPEKK